jgi:hypothetical protein
MCVAIVGVVVQTVWDLVLDVYVRRRPFVLSITGCVRTWENVEDRLGLSTGCARTLKTVCVQEISVWYS